MTAATSSTLPVEGAPSRAVRIWQIALLAIGVALLAIGGIVLLNDVNPKRYVGILIWFAGAIIIHDGIIAPLAFALHVLLRKGGRGIPIAVVAILQGAVVVGAVMALIVFPQIYKSAIGANNPSVVPLDYGQNLVIFYLVLIASTGIAIGGYLVARRQKLRASSSQD